LPFRLALLAHLGEKSIMASSLIGVGRAWSTVWLKDVLIVHHRPSCYSYKTEENAVERRKMWGLICPTVAPIFCANGWERGPPRMQVFDWASKRADASGQSLERRVVVPEKALRHSSQ
ncbi:hypothetical protein PIB30_051764, partial [Stylosanthes scabra]|nr:hypothetical protein [Stylosanthes scabra]